MVIINQGKYLLAHQESTLKAPHSQEAQKETSARWLFEKKSVGNININTVKTDGFVPVLSRTMGQQETSFCLLDTAQKQVDTDQWANMKHVQQHNKNCYITETCLCEDKSEAGQISGFVTNVSSQLHKEILYSDLHEKWTNSICYPCDTIKKVT